MVFSSTLLSYMNCIITVTLSYFYVVEIACEQFANTFQCVDITLHITHVQPIIVETLAYGIWFLNPHETLNKPANSSIVG